MLNCKDQSLKYLKKFGYNVVRLPRTDIAPLQILKRENNILVHLGKIDDLLNQDLAVPLPAIKKDEVTAAVSGQKTGELDLNVGLSILGNIIGAMGGGKIGVDAHYKNSKKLVFEFQDVLTDSVELTAVDKYLNTAGPNPFSKYILDLLHSGEIYLITSVIKSKSINVEALKTNGTKLDVDASAIQQILGPKVGVSTSSDNGNQVRYSGDQNLVFGFKAVKLNFKDGKYVSFDIVSDGGVAAAVAPSEADSYQWLTNSQMVDIESENPADNG